MNVKEEVLEVKTEEAEYDDEPKEECKRCHRRFYGPLKLGRHLIKQECTKPDIKPLFEPPVKTATIILSDSSDEDTEEELPSYQLSRTHDGGRDADRLDFPADIPENNDIGQKENSPDVSIIEIDQAFFPLPTKRSYKPLNISGLSDQKSFKKGVSSTSTPSCKTNVEKRPDPTNSVACEVVEDENVQVIEEFPDSPVRQTTFHASRDDIYTVLNDLQIESLKNFQWEAIEAVMGGESVIVTNKCGSGKSLCFVIPAIVLQRRGSNFTLVVEPTVALIQDQVQALNDKGIDAIALGAPAGSVSMRRTNYSRFSDEKDLPTLAYCTPEYIFGPSGDFLRNSKSGIKDKVGLIAIDECHKVLDRRSGYRDVYSRLMDFTKDVNAPVLACTATLSREWLISLKMMFSNRKPPRCILNPITRNNIGISIEPYRKQRNKEESGYNWATMVSEIADTVKEHISIVFVDTQKDAETISQGLNDLGIASRFMVGGNMTSEETKEAAKSFRDGKDQVLVATETYECGMHNERCAQVIRVGCPRNLPVLVQEMGRTGRNSSDGMMIILCNEFFDDQRLTTWAGWKSARSRIDKTDPEVANVIRQYCLAWKFLYSPLVGLCSHLPLSLFFDDPAEDTLVKVRSRKVVGCKCDVCSGVTGKDVDISEKLRELLKGLNDLSKLESSVTMRHFSEFARQSSAKWLCENASIADLGSFSFASSWANVGDDEIRRLVRIGISAGFIDLDFNFIFVGAKGIPRSFRRLSVSEEGLRMIESDEEFIVPDPFSKPLKSNGTAKRKTTGSSHHGLSSIIDMLSDKSCWLPLLNSQQFRLLGIEKDKFPFIYFVNNWRELKDASDKEFMRNDLQLTKAQGRVKSLSVKMDGEDVSVRIKINKCKGCKKCPAENCAKAFNNYAKYNSCQNHKGAMNHVINVGENCPVFFFFVYPEIEHDNRQWLGCISKEGGHNHPAPADWKLKSQTKVHLSKANSENPLAKPKDFQKGLGFSYEPMLVDPVASHSEKFTREISKTKGKGSPCYSKKFSTMEIVSQFNKIVEEVDKKTSPELADEEIKRQLDDLMQDYATEDHCVIIGERMYGLFSSRYQSAIFASATHIYLDICYIKNEELPGLFNVVAFCDELRRYVPVFRVFVNKQDAISIAYAIKAMFSTVQERHPDFHDGEMIEQIMVDFSDAEENGLRKALGDEMMDKVLRGCNFHFMQSAMRMAKLVTETEPQEEMFIAIARCVANCTEQDQVQKFFDVLGGKSPVLGISDWFDNENLREKAAVVRNESWKGAKTWIEWWLRPRHLAKVSAAFSGIPEEIWMSSQATNNPVESVNRTSKPHSLCSIKDSLRHVYYEDRRVAFMLIAVRSGGSVTYRNTARRSRKRRGTSSMGNAMNLPDTKKKIKPRKCPRGEKAVDHRVEVQYENVDGSATWEKGTIIMYSKTKGYLVQFDGCGPEHNKWEKKIADPDFRFID